MQGESMSGAVLSAAAVTHLVDAMLGLRYGSHESHAAQGRIVASHEALRAERNGWQQLAVETTDELTVAARDVATVCADRDALRARVAELERELTPMACGHLPREMFPQGHQYCDRCHEAEELDRAVARVAELEAQLRPVREAARRWNDAHDHAGDGGDGTRRFVQACTALRVAALGTISGPQETP